MLIGIGIYVMKAISGYRELVQNYDATSLPYLLIGIGTIGMLVHLGGLVMWFVSAEPETRNKTSFCMFVYVIAVALMSGVIFTGAVMCFTHQSHLRRALGSGLTKAMTEYNQYGKKKVYMDKLHIRYKCCGSKDYTDWFNVDWAGTGVTTLSHRYSSLLAPNRTQRRMYVAVVGSTLSQYTVQ